MTRVNPLRVPSPAETAERSAPIEMQAAPNNLPVVAEPKLNGAAPHAQSTPAIAATGVAKIAEAISGVMGEIGIVGKDGTNQFQNYKYAKMEDILQRLTPLIAKHGLAIIQTEHDRSMFDNDGVIAVRYAFTIIHKSGEVWPERPMQTGVSRCRDSKGGFDDKSFNKAHTAARKYFLLALFQIPTGDESDDADHHDAAPTTSQRAMAARSPVPSPSGKVAPHAIAPLKDEKVQQWAPRYMAHIAKAETVAELSLWDNLNGQALDTVNDKAPLLYETICKAVQKRQAELATEKPADAPSDVPSDKQGQAASNAPARPAGIPDAATAPDDFLCRY